MDSAAATRLAEGNCEVALRHDDSSRQSADGHGDSSAEPTAAYQEPKAAYHGPRLPSGKLQSRPNPPLTRAHYTGRGRTRGQCGTHAGGWPVSVVTDVSPAAAAGCSRSSAGLQGCAPRQAARHGQVRGLRCGRRWTARCQPSRHSIGNHQASRSLQQGYTRRSWKLGAGVRLFVRAAVGWLAGCRPVKRGLPVKLCAAGQLMPTGVGG